MPISQVVLSAAAAFPSLARLAVRSALALHPYPKQPQWLLRALKDRLGVRSSTRRTIDGFDMEFDPFDGPGRVFWKNGLTEPEMRDLVSKILRPGSVMLDVGAYIGQFSLVASKACPDARVFAFEPTPDVFRQMERNLQRNHSSAIPVNVALSDKPGRAKFYFYPESSDQNSLKELYPSAPFIEVEVDTIDRVCEARRLDRLDFVKIDTEGNDLSVLRGAEAAIARFRPTMTVEVSQHQRAYGYRGADIAAFLEARGYKLFRVGPTLEPYVPADDELDEESYFNVLALP